MNSLVRRRIISDIIQPATKGSILYGSNICTGSRLSVLTRKRYRLNILAPTRSKTLGIRSRFLLIVNPLIWWWTWHWFVLISHPLLLFHPIPEFNLNDNQERLVPPALQTLHSDLRFYPTLAVSHGRVVSSHALHRSFSPHPTAPLLRRLPFQKEGRKEFLVKPTRLHQLTIRDAAAAAAMRRRRPAARFSYYYDCSKLEAPSKFLTVNSHD